jgi:hypothetical protein
MKNVACEEERRQHERVRSASALNSDPGQKPGNQRRDGQRFGDVLGRGRLVATPSIGDAERAVSKPRRQASHGISGRASARAIRGTAVETDGGANHWIA